jgi:hypothetical protein
VANLGSGTLERFQSESGVFIHVSAEAFIGPLVGCFVCGAGLQRYTRHNKPTRE